MYRERKVYRIKSWCERKPVLVVTIRIYSVCARSSFAHPELSINSCWSGSTRFAFDPFRTRLNTAPCYRHGQSLHCCLGSIPYTSESHSRYWLEPMPMFQVCLSVSRECIIGTDLSLHRPLLIESIRRSHAPITDQRLHCSLIDRRCTRRDPRLIPNRDCTVRIYDSFRIHHNFGANTDQDPRCSLPIYPEYTSRLRS